MSRNLLNVPWQSMTLGERVRFLFEEGCSAEEVSCITSLPESECRRWGEANEPAFAHSGRRGFRKPRYNE